MKAILIVVLSFFLESIVSCYTPYTSLPLFTMISLLVCHSDLIEPKSYYTVCIVVGLFYDIAWLGLLLFHSVLFVLTGYVYHKLVHLMRDTWYYYLLILLLMIVVYRSFSYGLLLLIGYPVPSISTFLQIVFASFGWNLLYGFLLYQVMSIKKRSKYSSIHIECNR